MLRLLAFLMVLACFGAARADPVFPLGMRIGLEPAAGLSTKPGIDGFEDLDHKVSVAIAELPAASYNSLVDTLFGAAPPGANSAHREMFSFQDGVGYLHEANVTENGAALRRWVLVTMPLADGPRFVGVVNVKVPDAASGIYSEAVVRKMLASIVIRKPPIEERLGLVPFKLQNLANFKVVTVAPDTVLIADRSTGDGSEHPYMVINIGRASTTEMEDRDRFSRDLLAHAPLRGLTLQSAEEMRIGGVPGFEIRARAQGAHNEDLSIVQWVRFLGGGFVRIVGVVPREQWDDAFIRFRAVRDGVTMR